MAASWEELRDRYASFVNERGWERYHTPQNLSMAVSIEANELLENFLWFNNPPSEDVAADDELMAEVEDEIADVIIYLFALADELDIDLLEVVERKIEKNQRRFDEEEVSNLAADLERWQ